MLPLATLNDGASPLLKLKGILMKVSKNNVFLPESLSEYVANMSAEDMGELRVLIYVLSEKEDKDTSEIAGALSMDEQEAVAAVAFWRGMGLLKAGGRASIKSTVKEPAKKASEEKTPLPASVRDTDTRTYTGEEIERIMQEKPELVSLLDFAQARLERVFSPSDVAKLVYLEDYILMTAPMIMRVIDYCVESDKKSMRYVEKTALSIYDEGIQTYEALESYFENKKKAKSNEGTVRRILGIGERNFTSAEKAHIAKWFGEYESSTELIEYAYEKTIASISKPSVPYMSKLLMTWHEKGFKTVKDVENGRNAGTDIRNIDLSGFDEAIPAKKEENHENKAGLDLDDFFENN